MTFLEGGHRRAAPDLRAHREKAGLHLRDLRRIKPVRADLARTRDTRRVVGANEIRACRHDDRIARAGVRVVVQRRRNLGATIDQVLVVVRGRQRGRDMSGVAIRLRVQGRADRLAEARHDIWLVVIQVDPITLDRGHAVVGNDYQVDREMQRRQG